MTVCVMTSVIEIPFQIPNCDFSHPAISCTSHVDIRYFPPASSVRSGSDRCAQMVTELSLDQVTQI